MTATLLIAVTNLHIFRFDTPFKDPKMCSPAQQCVVGTSCGKLKIRCDIVGFRHG